MDDANSQKGSAPAAERTVSPLGVARLALLFGLLTGALELTQWLVRNAVSGGVSLGDFQMSRHFFWMIPASNLVIFGGSGAVLGLVAWLRPRWAGRVALWAMGFLCGLALLLTVPGLYAFAAVALAAGVGAMTSRHGSTHLPRFQRLLVVAPLVLGAVAASLHGWDRIHAALAERRPAPAPAAVKETPNVLLLVLDTVRAESLSLYGYDRDTTPNLNRLASRAVRFDQARSTAPWTLPSHASMLTGRWPHELDVGERKPMGRAFPTLAEALAAHGYATAGFIANTFFCNAWFGLGRGFQHYDDFYEEQTAVSMEEALRCSSLGRLAVRMLSDPFGGVERRRKDAGRINAAFLNWLDRKGEDDRPFFAFLNYFDAHGPFVPPADADRPFGRPPADADEEALIREWDVRSRVGLSDEQLALARDSYDDCLAYLDRRIGELFDELERRGALDDTLVILTSDHGEGLGEHDLIGHGRSLYDQETRVPLLVFLPHGARGGQSIGAPVSLRDVPATVLDVLGLDPSAFPGASLARRPSDEAAVLTEVRIKEEVSRNLARPPAWRGPMAALVAEGFSYIRNADGREELYEVAADPGQLHDLAPTPGSAATLERMRARLEALAPDEDDD
ncbi:sulfatase [Paludisphaera mucosa]|uniref:Sulfatase n=1 Tax=Paludisphaera mucosa TaxID=3030827 RepID=A0ABT6FBM6_9BACT|nr:sulfatase [Paludisphaera mucosa]MDG3004780.1 sulfatase [Paludisphaera mucosa]